MPTATGICNHFSVNRFYAYCAPATGAGPWGPVRVAATSRGVAAVALQATPEAFEAELASRGLVTDETRAGAATRDLAGRAVAAVCALLAGEAIDLSSYPVDLGDRPAWDRLVLDAVRAIPRGEVASYGEVAARIGRPGAARAVGGAVGRNPVGLVVPCHRVIAAGGKLGGYGIAAMGGREGALELKRALLALEGVEIRR